MTFRGLSLRDLEYVVAVADHGHFGRAAEACRVSQPSLSSGVRKVEDAIGVRVFERTSRRVMPTRVGEEVVLRARAVLAAAARMMDAGVEATAPLAGPFALGAIATVGPYLFAHSLAPLREAYPELLLTIEEGLTEHLLTRLREGALDAVVLSPPIDDHGLELIPLYREPFRLAVEAQSPLASTPSVHVADLDPAGAVLLEEGHCLRDQALSLCGGTGHRPRHTAMSLETLKAMVAAGIGYSLVPAGAVPGETDLGGLVRYRVLAEEKIGRTVALAYRRSRDRVDDVRRMAGILRDHGPPGTFAIAGL
ncbi:DNA-binding transcriptional regulator OxyR [Thalassobaculum fulvum]|uniref:DNA-binding transcriptional regulator OxyR n=1 Tax=Thalassobaculum fulvum TaxID=1633335 RepID=A0A919CSM7_9PROT|nr:LysR substrate-binding domain-containing protein [Thalassobaculum fulvum]GHD63080.1 DNA-binding transcriptional regulator OxyR [Thalassobaculum fulvum]